MVLARSKSRPLADSRWAILSIQFSLVAITILIWEVATQKEILNPMFFGRPSIIVEILFESLADGSLLRAGWITAVETLYGFGAGMLAGTLLGLSLWWSSSAAKVLEPLLILLNAIPKITLAPVFIVLLGVGIWMKVALSFANVVILATLSAYLGAKQSDLDLIDLVRSFGGNRWQVFLRVVLPSSYPSIISCMEIAIGLAFVGAVIGEFLAAREGLGYLAIYGSNIFNMSLIWVAVIALMALALLLYAAVRKLKGWLLGWRPFQEER